MKTTLKPILIIVLIACLLVGMLPGSVARGALLVDPQKTDREDGIISNAAKLTGAGVEEQFSTVVEQASSNRFAVIGDYGQAGDAERDVADLVKSWNPEIIVTTGDNNYNDGSADTIDENIGKYRDGFEHFEILNQHQDEQNYYFHFLTPRDYDTFFKFVRENNISSFVSSSAFKTKFTASSKRFFASCLIVILFILRIF